jgi:hypothetical protein
MTFKKKIASIIRYCPPLFKFGSKLYHKINGGFKSLSPGAPAAIEWAMKKAAEIQPDRGGVTIMSSAFIRDIPF